jgi:hypothetical protein
MSDTEKGDKVYEENNHFDPCRFSAVSIDELSACRGNGVFCTGKRNG